MFVVLSVVIAQSHCEHSPSSLDECRLSARWLPTLRPSQSTWAVSPLVHCYHLHITVAICYYYSVHKLILILQSHEG